MKKFIFFTCCLILFAACTDKETKQRELDLKEKELELKQKELDLKGKGDTSIKGQEDSGLMGTIIGKGVIIRQSNSVESAKLGNFDENEQVTILSEARPQNQNQAIAAKPIKLYDDYDGKLITTLNKGKALVIENFDGSVYKVSYQDPKFGKLYATVFPDELQNISNEVWYKVRRKTGDEGWVLGKFLKK